LYFLSHNVFSFEKIDLCGAGGPSRVIVGKNTGGVNFQN
jgi:hypothetical protein